MIIGRQGEQPFPITDMTVSKRHCEITPSGTAAGEYVLKDLDSTQGTWIDGRRIVQVTVTGDTEVRLGPNVKLKVKQLFEPAQPKRNQPEADITHLEQVYDTYRQANIDLQRSVAMKTFYRSLPPVLMSVLFALTMIFGDNDTVRSLRPFVGVLTIAAVALTTTLMWRGQKNAPEQRSKIADRFKVDYTCPHCHNFLGDLPYESLRQKGECSYCHCHWRS